MHSRITEARVGAGAGLPGVSAGLGVAFAHAFAEAGWMTDYDKALETTFRLRNRPAERETEEYRRARVKRRAGHRHVARNNRRATETRNWI